MADKRKLPEEERMRQQNRQQEDAPKQQMPPEQEAQQEQPAKPQIDPRMFMAAMAAQKQAAMESPAGRSIGQAEGMPGEGAVQDNEPARGFVPAQPMMEKRMTKDRLTKAMQDLYKYKSGKRHLESRLVEVEQWWKLRHWEWMQEKGNPNDIRTASGWLFNVIVSKHADAIQSIPEANILPREESDKATAKMLSGIIPCILDQNRFESAYSDITWQKLKGGTGVYGIFWDKSKHNGLGDIAIKKVNLLHLFWEPGISNIQDSQQVFHVEAVDIDQLKGQYPQLANENLTSGAVSLRKYITDDPVDNSNKTAVVDWYYHAYEGGRKVLHYCKFVNDVVLYSTEDDPQLR